MGETQTAQTAQTAAERARDLLDAAAEANTYGHHSVEQAGLGAVRDAVVASGAASLAVAEEMPATRAEIAQVAAAVRDLTKTLESVLGELGSRVSEVERVLDTNAVELIGEVSEVCTELAEIGAALRKPEPVRPRRRWLLGGGR
ncbi:hypothetical protein [Actinomadura coerulea]|uniref:hypothetical protein n=1 Tax=Actinomadura coerulea TaxID=46159 RepID=UPI003432A873